MMSWHESVLCTRFFDILGRVKRKGIIGYWKFVMGREQYPFVGVGLYGQNLLYFSFRLPFKNTGTYSFMCELFFLP